MEKTLRIAGIGMNNNFVDDSPQSVKPQASSTFMFSRTELDLKDADEENAFQSPKTDTMASSTTSSLGVIDLEKQSLLFDKDESISQRLQESIRESKCYLDEQRSMGFSRFKRRLDDISIPKNSSSDDLSIEAKEQFNFFEKAVPSNSPKVLSQLNSSVTAKPIPSSPSTKVSLFSDISNGTSPLFDSSFDCGKAAVMKLEADQKENRREFGSLPVTPTNISVNSENSDERERQFTEFIRAKCYSPEEISNVLRNKLNLDSKESAPIMVNTVSNSLSPVTCEENFEKASSNCQLPSQIPKAVPHTLLKSDSNFTPETDRLSGIEEKFNSVISNWSAHENFVFDSKNGSISSALGSDFWEESRASSIASINQIAEALRRKSLMAEPKLAIEHLLSIGKNKSQVVSTVSACESSTKSIPSSVKTVVPRRTQYENTPITSRCVNAPGTITCSTNNLRVDSVIGKVCTRNVPCVSEFTTARKLLESRIEQNDSNASQISFPLTNDSADKKHFSLSKTVSLLDLSDDSESPHDEFWKLNVPVETHDSGDFLFNHLNAGRDKTRHLSDDLMSMLKCGSATTNTATEPVRQISFSHNITSAEDFCDTFDGDSASDVIHAGTLCLGTQVEVIIDIENPCREPLKYKMALKSILLNGVINLRAVSVMLVSNYPDVILLPKSDNEIKIMLSPLMPGKLDVVLEFISEEKKYSNITRQIRITGENPKLKVEFPERAEINFELLAESSVKNMPLLLRNKGIARLPLRLFIFEGSKRTFLARTVIEPSETFECDVRVTTFELSETQAPIINLTGVLMIVLDTFEEASLGKSMILQTLPLSAQVGKTSIVVNDGAPLTFSCSPLLKSSSHLINVTNTGMVPLDITVQTVESGQSEFLIEPHIFQLLPRNTKSLKTVFKPSTKERKREIDLHLIFNGTSKKYSTKIVGIVESDVVSSSMGSPLRHSPTTCVTPHSSSSDSSTGAEGPMELDCTHYSISWGSVPLHTKNIQTITLRNRGSQKEKLLLSIADSNGAFRFVENKSSHRDLKLTLEPRESRKISVNFMPFLADQAMNGRIVIIRRHSLEASVGEFQKRVIPLYGIGGTAKISFSGVFRDNENRLWITPESESLETKFSIENMGDSVAFVKIISEDLDDAVVPEEMVLLPAESAEVNYTVHLNKDRVDSLHKQNPSKEVLLANKLTVLSGCESTRLRLKRLWTKYEEFDNIQRIRNKLELLMDMNSPSKVMIESLADSQFVLSNLWYDGVDEQIIGVLLPEQQLESACLDSTIVFKDLADVSTVS